MKHWTIGAVFLIASSITLTLYPILELSRLILIDPRTSFFGGELELFLIWWAYLSMPFILWALLREMKRGKDGI